MNEKIPVKTVTPVKVHKPKGGAEGKRHDSRSRIYVRAVQGPLETFRRFFGLFFLALFAVIPWIQYNGHQAVLLDIGEQRFTIFSLTLCISFSFLMLVSHHSYDCAVHGHV